MASTVSTGNVWSRSQASACGAISAVGEVAHDLAELLLLVGEVEVHAASVRPDDPAADPDRLAGDRVGAVVPVDRRPTPLAVVGGRLLTELRRRHRRPRRARRRRASGRSCCRSTATPVCARFAHASGPARPWPGPTVARPCRPTAGRSSLDRGRVRGGRRARSARRSPPATSTR